MLILSFVISFIIFVTSNTIAQHADEIIGSYHLPNDMDIEIYKEGCTFSGKIIGLDNLNDGQTKDRNNPKKSKQDDLLIGMVIIHNLEYSKEEKEWVNGRMYGPEKGMVFNLKITEIRKNEIDVVGSKYFFWKTMTWIRIN